MYDFRKTPPVPSRTIRKRTYKDFKNQAFLQDLQQVDWSSVYSCIDVDNAVSTFTDLFSQVLNIHAPWIIYQQRKIYTPWITKDTIELMKLRDDAKAKASTGRC